MASISTPYQNDLSWASILNTMGRIEDIFRQQVDSETYIAGLYDQIYEILTMLHQLLPGSTEQTFGFIVRCYVLTVELYERKPAFKTGWLRVMAILAKYAGQIPSASRSVWLNIATQRYADCARENPMDGKFYYYQAKITRESGLNQLFFFCKSIEAEYPHIASISDVVLYAVEKLLKELIILLDLRMQNERVNWTVDGFLFAVCNITAIRQNQPAIVIPGLINAATQAFTLELSTNMSGRIFKLMIASDDTSILPYVHVWLVFLQFGLDHIQAGLFVKNGFSWGALIRFLNMLRTKVSISFETSRFPMGNVHPLPEDWLLNGLQWTMGYFPDGWFQSEAAQSDAKFIERPSHVFSRMERILWLAYKIAEDGKWLTSMKINLR
ncbi:hypothetical protein DFH27DRAFT_646141 [Peziza echinospora]|nr:hypothetical protein DFH27DRAFT_646141 [Peziza echinospora]